jgi:hypothetical protein
MSKTEKLFVDLINKTEGAELSQMFGKPCGKLNKKAFLAFFEDEVVFRLGKEHIEKWKLKIPDAKNFDPSGKGRAMKDWLQVNHSHKKHYNKLLELSLDFTFP